KEAESALAELETRLEAGDAAGMEVAADRLRKAGAAVGAPGLPDDAFRIKLAARREDLDYARTLIDRAGTLAAGFRRLWETGEEPPS
ncbi:MAG: hypothetical protein ACLFTV_16470, partial [Desulfococcaceae bacterium]